MPFDRNLSGGAEDFGSPYLRDYEHAALTFRSNHYQNAPKLKFLFHTYFEINPEAFQGFSRVGVGSIDSTTNFGVLVKQVNLPKYTVETSTMQQYNRKRIVQTRLRYEPVEVTFHDDGGDQINQLWEAYYTYYYYDAMNPNVQFGGARGSSGSGPNDYNSRNIYNASIAGDNNWGYSSDSTTGSQVKIPFFKNITIFGFNQHNFTAYTLVNPLITYFSHDTYDYSAGNGIMQSRMTLAYETVLYNYGVLDGRSPDNLIPTFTSSGTYDREPSPIWNDGANSLNNLGNPTNGGSIEPDRREPTNEPFLDENGRLVFPPEPDPSNNGDGPAQPSVFDGLLEEDPSGSSSSRGLFVFPTPGSTPADSLGADAPPAGVDTDRTTIRDEPVSGVQFTGQELTSSSRGIDPPFLI